MKRGRSGQVIVLAIAGMVIAAAASGAAVEGYSHGRHPLAWLGAVQLGTAGMLFDVFGFLLPGLAAAWIAWGLRAALPAGSGWIARIGAQLVLLAALAFAAQGLLPLDLENTDGGAGRGHAAAWLGWALAFPLGALALAAGLRDSNGGRRLAGWSHLPSGPRHMDGRARGHAFAHHVVHPRAGSHCRDPAGARWSQGERGCAMARRTLP